MIHPDNGIFIYSVLKRNEISSHEKSWKNLKYILLSESSHLKSVGLQLYDSVEKAKLWT